MYRFIMQHGCTIRSQKLLSEEFFNFGNKCALAKSIEIYHQKKKKKMRVGIKIKKEQNKISQNTTTNSHHFYA